jgi:hypothetical protein
MDEIQSNSRSPCRYVPQTHHVENVVLLEKIGLSLEVKSLPYWNLILLLSLEFGLLKLELYFYEKNNTVTVCDSLLFLSCEKMISVMPIRLPLPA